MIYALMLLAASQGKLEVNVGAKKRSRVERFKLLIGCQAMFFSPCYQPYFIKK